LLLELGGTRGRVASAVTGERKDAILGDRVGQ